eukprot:XP_001695779.1 serine/threonine protein kinase [Chlamydomonas reinhardtii]
MCINTGRGRSAFSVLGLCPRGLGLAASKLRAHLSAASDNYLLRRAVAPGAQGQHVGQLGVPLHSLSTDFGGSDSPVGHPHGPPHQSLFKHTVTADLGSPSPTRLGDYEVTRRIYKGATSAVYQATCLRSGLPVALKVYFLNKVPPNAMHMIAREITIHADVAHKHIAMLYGAFQEEGRLVLVQEYAARGDLYGIYRALRRRMTEEQVTALSYLHSRGVCHRDVKPENLLYTQDWKLLIADFGVSINLNQERAVTRAGTLDYMAPEVERCPIKYQPQDNKDVPGLAYGTAVDIWATGVLAYELLFISLALAEDPQERPTSVELLNHSWLRRAMQRRVLMSRSNKFSGGDVAGGPPSAGGSPTAAVGWLPLCRESLLVKYSWVSSTRL